MKKGQIPSLIDRERFIRPLVKLNFPEKCFRGANWAQILEN